MTQLQVVSVQSGNVLGTVELTEDGELRASSPGVQRDLEQMARARGWSHREAFERFNGWSNGYVQILPVDQ